MPTIRINPIKETPQQLAADREKLVNMLIAAGHLREIAENMARAATKISFPAGTIEFVQPSGRKLILARKGGATLTPNEAAFVESETIKALHKVWAGNELLGKTA
ncbi:MAG: hypothetical protein FWF97_04895 [Alphaproteobacteria bacterium]|nr:hypothetical protein [Alphaproteobacteria bacterium]